MELNWPGEDDPRRQEVRRWLESHPDATQADLHDRGYIVPGWPEPWGLNADAELQVVIAQELERAGIDSPAIMTPLPTTTCGPSILEFGTEWQQQRYLPPGLTGEELWCQLYSEPSCGSDLAALRTTAVLDGDDYVVNGQKIWTGAAHISQVGMMLARTDPSKPKHKGLSMFIIDMDLPGITVHPIYDLTGEHSFNSVFFDNVRVPVKNRLGEENQGWPIMHYQMQAERVLLGRPALIFGRGPTARELALGMQEIDALDDPVVEDETARLFVEGEVLRILNLQTLSDAVNDRQPGPSAAVHKMMSAPHGQRVAQAAKAEQGLDGMRTGAEPYPGQVRPNGGRYDSWDYTSWLSLGNTLGGGSHQVMLNIVSERVLGMPRDGDQSASLPWTEAVKASAGGAK